MAEFISGLFVEQPREGAPSFVKGKLSIQADKFIKYCKEKANSKGYLNIDLLESKEGKLYAKLNDWKPTESFVKNEDGSIGVEESEDIDVKSIPF